MDDDRAVAEEGADSFGCGGVEIEVGGLEWVARDVPVFAGEVAYLAGFGLGGITDGGFAADIGV